MFKKRRQRAKKYTLTCFGRVDGDSCSTTEGETEDESLFESEVDEDSLSTAPDPTWDSGYLDVLERRTSGFVLSGAEADNIPGLNATSGKGAQLFEQQRKKTEKHNSVNQVPNGMPQQLETIFPHTPVQPTTQITPFTSHSTNTVNGEPVVVSRTSVMLSSPGQTPLHTMAGTFSEQSDPPSGSLVHNRTARPFAPGCVSHRAATAPVIFKPNTPKNSLTQTQAVSMATMPVSFSTNTSDGKKAIASSSLYIPLRPSTVSGPITALSPTSSVASAPFSPVSSNSLPISSQGLGKPAYFSDPPAPVPKFNQVPNEDSQLYSLRPPQNMPFSPPPVLAKSIYHPPLPPPRPLQSFVSTYTPNPAPTPIAQAPAPTHPPPQVGQMPPSPTHKVSFNPYISVATTTSDNLVSPMAQQCPLSDSSGSMSSREQRISIPASRTGILLEARHRASKKPMFNRPEEKKPVAYNPELLSLVQNLDERSRPGGEPGFESGPEEDFLNLGAEACNFMQANKNRAPPPVAPKPPNSTVEIPQMGGKGADLFARRQSRMDRYVVDKHPRSPAQPREPSPTPSMPGHWKYSPNVRAPPPISYNPLLSPSCPPIAQRGTKANETLRSGNKKSTGQHKQGIKALDYMSRQPYQLNSSLFSYGGGVPQTAPNQPTYAQHQQPQANGFGINTSTLNPPKQVPVKSSRVYEIKRFSTPTPMSAPTTLTPTVIAPRSATTLAEPIWRTDLNSPPPVNSQPAAHFSPPPPAPTGALPALPKFYTAPVQSAVPTPAQHPVQTYMPFQVAKQFQSAPDLSPISPTGMRSVVSGSSQNVQVPRPRFSVSNLGLQPKVWRPGYMN